MPHQMIDAQTCLSCSDVFDFAQYGSHCGGHCCYYCDECTREREYRDYDTDSRVHSYSWSPRRFNPKGDYPAEVLMGLELEICGSQRDIANAVGMVDPDEYHLYLKNDSSISGAEMVTHPMTLRWAKEWRADNGRAFNRVLTRLALEGCDTDDSDTYGIHVHVSRNAFRNYGRPSATHQLTWLLFQYRNTAQLETLARRRSDQWAAFRRPQPGELKRKAQAHTGAGSDRYVAVNCNNERTYELRFFAATLDPGEFWSTLEYADASVEYTRHLKSRDILKGGALQWSRFVEWLENREDRYPNLIDQLVTHDNLS